MKKKESIMQEEKKIEDLKKTSDSIEQLEKEIINKKRLPEEEKTKIYKKVFENMLIADILMAFFYLISLGSFNIETQTFLMDLKVFSVGLILFTIILFEISYRKENGNLCIHGIECMAVAICILFFNYLYTMYMKDFYLYVSTFAYISSAYYIGKSIMIYRKMKKQYIASLSDIDEIIKK